MAKKFAEHVDEHAPPGFECRSCGEKDGRHLDDPGCTMPYTHRCPGCGSQVDSHFEGCTIAAAALDGDSGRAGRST